MATDNAFKDEKMPDYIFKSTFADERDDVKPCWVITLSALGVGIAVIGFVYLVNLPPKNQLLAKNAALETVVSVTPEAN